MMRRAVALGLLLAAPLMLVWSEAVNPTVMPGNREVICIGEGCTHLTGEVQLIPAQVLHR